MYRNFVGATLFSGLINPKIAKIKEVNTKENKFYAKVAVACKDSETK